MLDGLRSHPDRLLVDHLLGTARKAEKKADKIPWKKFGIEHERGLELIKLCALSHDFAKASGAFQDSLMGAGKRKVTHAPLSSLITFHVLRSRGFEEKYRLFGYFVVRHHHDDFPKFGLCEEEPSLKELEEQFRSVPKEFAEWFEKVTETKLPSDLNQVFERLDKEMAVFQFDNDFSIEDYLLLHTMSSILVSSDREDAALKDFEISPQRKLTIDLLERYVSRLPKDTPIHPFREEFQKNVKESVEKIDSNILSLTAPTGIGKTLANLRLALSLSSRDSLLVYALPFINIIDQTVDTVYKVMEGVDFDALTVLPYHHLADPEYRRDEIQRKKSIQWVLMEGWNAQLVVTTFVSLFESLFTNKRVPFFYKLFDSVIVLDEVQSIPHKYWEPLSKLLETLSKFGSKIVLSTATQPMMIENTKEVFGKNLGLNRTKVSYHGEVTFADFLERLRKIALESKRKGDRLLVVLNTVREASETFKSLKGSLEGVPIYYLSSHVIPKQRLSRILKMKQNKGSFICVSTQVIEAGVDLSFDTVIRDEGPLDSIVQVSGRCNRTFERPIGNVYVYKVIDDASERRRTFASYVYDSLLLDITEKILKERSDIEEKDFDKLTFEYFSKLKKRANQDKEELMRFLKNLDFPEIQGRFRIIDRKLPTVAVFIEYDEEAMELRRKFNEIVEAKEIDRYEKVAEIAKLLKKMSMYTIDIPVDEEKLGGALIQENGLLVVTHDNLKYWYDKEIGFYRSEDVMMF